MNEIEENEEFEELGEENEASEVEEIEKIQQPKYEIRDNSKRSRYALIVFSLYILLTIVGTFSGYYQLQLLERIQNGEIITFAIADRADFIQRIIGITQFALYIVTVVVFLNWFRRAYANLERLGCYIENRENMALWAWFIPIISLFKPLQMMIEIWRNTQEKITEFDSSYTTRNGVVYVIGTWWAIFLVSAILGKIILQGTFNQNTVEEMVSNSTTTIISDILQIIEGLLVIYIVSSLSKIETKLATEVEKSGGMVWK